MSKHAKTRDIVLAGTANANIDFEDLCSMLVRMEFKARQSGSHRIFSKSGVKEIINLQPRRDGKAKPYQVRQVKELIELYKLTTT